ncbi:MAG TPA: methylated-DNA--[protein]-cysteine S-methyltransferase [Pseudonocardiaceae bacterium]|nr:methylated-DNA--[protein]-cysteine S-methyltransferase [Pseudonocardiaceae bacterium]
MTPAPGHTVFDTPIGACGIGWTAIGVRTVRLPEGSPTQTTARLLRWYPDLPAAAPPAAIASVISDIRALLTGASTDLSRVELDLTDVPAFEQRVYAAARAIPPGEFVTYGELADRLGEPGAARAVGRALGRNPVPIIVPCHRVLAAGGRTGGFSAPGGVSTKMRMLAIEGATLF